MILVQVGSGAGNLDLNYQDGFSNFAKKIRKNPQIFSVEANSIHIPKLRKYWRYKKNVKIFNYAIIPDNIKKKKINFYYSDKDKPDFQIFSNSESLVKKHFPDSKIRKKLVKCISITDFFKKNKINEINYLALDIEGMDFEVLYNLNFNKVNIKHISFEHLHLSFIQKIKIVFKLTAHNYFFSGMGFDIRNSDWMFSKNYDQNKIKTFLLPFTPRRIWKKFLPSAFI